MDTYCDAMDDIIENVPAPHTEAIGIKLRLTIECQPGDTRRDPARPITEPSCSFALSTK